MCDIGHSSITTDKQVAPNRTLAELADTWNTLIPVTTYSDKKYYQGQSYDFPNLYLTQHVPLWSRQDPIDTRAVIQNELLLRRHFDK